MYAKVLHSELVSLELELASTSFISCKIKLGANVLMCLCLQNRYTTKAVDISEIIEDVKHKDIYNIIIGKEIFVRII